jgi:hypothetical protein
LDGVIHAYLGYNTVPIQKQRMAVVLLVKDISGKSTSVIGTIVAYVEQFYAQEIMMSIISSAVG